MPPISASNQTAPWAANTMNQSIGIENRVLHRDARAAFLAAAGASGLASPPAATFSALPMTTFWLRQITPHTLRNIVMPKSMPVRIAVPLDPVEVEVHVLAVALDGEQHEPEQER